MFQALHKDTLVKADFHVGERIAGELQRSVVREVFEGLSVPLVSKEDAILSKLIWIREGSQKSRSDIIGMFLGPTPFDLAVVRQRARTIGCAKLLEEIEREVENLGSEG